jgi:hypothetical protein
MIILETPFIIEKENRLKTDDISAIPTFCKISIIYISEHVSKTKLYTKMKQ